MINGIWGSGWPSGKGRQKFTIQKKIDLAQVRILAGQKKASIPIWSSPPLSPRLGPSPIFRSCYDATHICRDNLSRASNATKKNIMYEAYPLMQSFPLWKI